MTVIERKKKQLEKNHHIAEPPIEQNVLPRQCCPAFLPREGALPGERECWFCAYADFHLDKPKALEVGICRYPNINKKIRPKRNFTHETEST